MSSRNNRIYAYDREKASKIYETLSLIKDNAINLSNEIIKSHKDELTRQGFDVDYLSVCDPITWNDLIAFNSRPMLVAVAASISGIRLIDNILID